MDPLPVLGKIGAIYKYIRDENGKLTGQTEAVTTIQPIQYIITAKMDGTCCYIKDGQIFARQDIKHNISNAPTSWFPTDGVEPDKNGHIIGFRPLDRKRGDKWHIMAIDEDTTKARFIEYNSNLNTFSYIIKPISDMNGKTVELVGPSVNANRHKLTKHAFIVHGSIIVNAPWNNKEALKTWLDTDGKYYEGIVIHDIHNHTHYKCHRGHINNYVGGEWDGYPLPISE